MSMKKMLAVVAAAACVAFAAPAFAANPFMDVPMHHWAYDAVSQLSARGIISGYKDGTFKGNRPITRYEMSMMIANAMSKGGLSGQDAALLKKLVVEFKDELDNLGVKVDGFDSRIAALESGVGGWKFWGRVQLTSNWFGENHKTSEPGGVKPYEGIRMSTMRIQMSKQVDENIKFSGRWNGSTAAFDRFYFDAKNFLFGSTLRAGLFLSDWEDDDGLADNDSFVTDFTVTGFQLTKAIGNGEFVALVGADPEASSDSYIYGARFKMAPSEKFWVSVNALMFDPATAAARVNNYWLGAGFKVAEGVDLTGAYYMQKKMAMGGGADTSANAWTAFVNVDQDKLKFTSLRLQYARIDKGFALANTPWAYDDGFFKGPSTGADDVTVWAIKAEQKWNDQFSTFGRYVKTSGKSADLKNWTLGVNYKFTPALSFELAYDNVDFNAPNTSDYMIRLRTRLNF